MSTATTTPTITIRYELNPPKQIEVGELSTSKTHKFLVDADVAKGQGQYYTALQKVLAEARNQLGDELTVWRDAVGKAELNKETPKTLNYDAEAVDDDEE